MSYKTPENALKSDQIYSVHTQYASIIYEVDISLLDSGGSSPQSSSIVPTQAFKVSNVRAGWVLLG